MILFPVFLFLLACNNNPTETNNLSATNKNLSVRSNAPKDYSADSTKKWTRNVVDFLGTPGNTINYTDANFQKQGKWITYDAKGKVVKTEYYKDGKLIEGC